MKKFCLLERIIVFLISIYLASTFFMPIFSFDEFTEYEFTKADKDYSVKYQAEQKTIATNVSAFDVIHIYFMSRSTYVEINREYLLYKKDLDKKLDNKEVTSEEYNTLCADYEEAGKYYFGQYSSTSSYRLESNSFALLVATIFCYAVFLVMFVMSAINLILSKQNLYLANQVISWVTIGGAVAILFIIFVFYSEAKELLTIDEVYKITIICATPKTILFINIGITAFLGIFCPIVGKRNEKKELSAKSVPTIIAYKQPKYRFNNHKMNRRKYKF